MTKADGGHAFPNITPDMNVDGGPGMTLKDYFAGQALMGILAYDAEGAGRSVFDWGDRAEAAYKAADAMLKERSS